MPIGVVSSIGKSGSLAWGGFEESVSRLRFRNLTHISILIPEPWPLPAWGSGGRWWSWDGSGFGALWAFIDIDLNKYSNVTTGKIYEVLRKKERKGSIWEQRSKSFHILQVKDKIKRAARTTVPDVIITEVGGTMGDIESLLFYEALRQMKADVGADNVMYVSIRPSCPIKAAGEWRPANSALQSELRVWGSSLICWYPHREASAGQNIKTKLAQFCDVAPGRHWESWILGIFIKIPLNLRGAKDGPNRLMHLKLDAPAAEVWQSGHGRRVMNLKNQVAIALVGKYVELPDAYISVVEALKHAGYANDAELDWLDWCESGGRKRRRASWKCGWDYRSGGFGQRGTEVGSGNPLCAWAGCAYAGHLLGMQLTCVRIRRHILGLADA